jgi:hypothetical protein
MMQDYFIENISSLINLWCSGTRVFNLKIKNLRKMRMCCFKGVDGHCSLTLRSTIEIVFSPFYLCILVKTTGIESSREKKFSSPLPRCFSLSQNFNFAYAQKFEKKNSILFARWKSLVYTKKILEHVFPNFYAWEKWNFGGE